MLEIFELEIINIDYNVDDVTNKIDNVDNQEVINSSTFDITVYDIVEMD